MTARRPAPDRRPLDQPADLTALWAALLAREVGHQRVVWLLFLDQDRSPTGAVITLDDVPDGPYDVSLADLVGLCREFLDGPGAVEAVALLMSRPGGAPWTVSDRAWGRFLVQTNEILGAAWPVHWAHERAVEEFRLPEP